MSLYELLLFLHVAMAAIWAGGAVMIQFFALRILGSGEPARQAALGGDVEWIANRLLIPASLLAVVTGVAMVIESDAWSFGDDWVVIGLVLFAITFVAGTFFFGPESKRIGKLAEAEGPTSAAVQARVGRILAFTRPDIVLLFLIIFDMSVKPSFGDVSLWVAVAVAAVLAFLLARHGLATRVQPAPATE
ncbi:MAG: DUF2269 domain-containing protein [Actinomycetota bacterium]|nr:DUF2269 domain-containing protein [Actinomycetota bacterium]